MLSPGQFNNLRVLVVGDVMLDRYWYGDVERISPEAPVPVVGVTGLEERAGGAANVASNITALGAQCVLLSVVGKDEAGDSLRNILQSSGAKLALHIDSEAKTTVKLRILSRNQQLLRADFETRPSHEILSLCLSDYHQALVESDIVIISDYGKGGLLHIEEMIAGAREQNVPIIVDPKGTDFKRYRGATVITPNIKELQCVVGQWNDEVDLHSRANALLKELSLESLLVTRSEHGMTLFQHDGAVLNSPARAREVYDVSGAGDTVVSAFAVSFAAGLADKEKLAIANTAAGIVIGKLGTATVSEAELLSSLQSLDP